MSTNIFSIAIVIMCIWAIMESHRHETRLWRLIWTASAGILVLGEAAILLPH